MNKQKGVNTMSKVKEWAYDEAEKKVDNIIFKLKDGQIDLTTASDLTMLIKCVQCIQRCQCSINLK